MTLALLLVTLGLYAVESAAWRTLFTLAHLAALAALLPLGIVLVRHAFRQARLSGDPGIVGVFRRYRATIVVLALIALAVAISLANFEDGSRLARRSANFITVGLVLMLVIRYLRWSARMRGRPTLGEGRLF